MGKPNRQQRRAAERDKEAYGFAKLASLKIAPKSPPRRKLSLTLVVSVIIAALLCGGGYLAYSMVSAHVALQTKNVGQRTK